MKIDQKVVFYLKHKKQIDEWGNLGKRVPPLAHKFFASLFPLLEDRAAALPGNPKVAHELESNYPKLKLYDPRWTNSEGQLLTFIGHEYYKKTDFLNSYAGIWVDKVRDKSGLLHGLIKGRVADRVSQHDLQYGSWWVIYRYQKPSSDNYWEHLDEFGAHIVDSICQYWTVFHQDTTDALAEYETANKGESPVT
jgi:hypothetical protein